MARHQAFAACRRRYWYAYHGAAADPEVARLRRLSSLPQWAGTVVHETLERVLRASARVPSVTEQEALVHEAVHTRMVADWRTSEGETGAFRLFEHEYGVPVEIEDKKIAVDVVKRSLRNAFASETLREAVDPGTRLALEELATFETTDGVTVQLRMDVAYRRGREVRIVDWKTSLTEHRLVKVQLAAYALCAVAKGWGEASHVTTEVATLLVPRFHRRTVDEKTLTRSRAFIGKSAAAIEAAGDAMDAFPRIDQPRTCARCNFRRLCWPRDLPQA